MKIGLFFLIGLLYVVGGVGVLTGTVRRSRGKDDWMFKVGLYCLCASALIAIGMSVGHLFLK